MNHDYIGSFWQCQMSQKESLTPTSPLLMQFYLGHLTSMYKTLK